MYGTFVGYAATNQYIVTAGAPTRDCSIELDHSDSRPNYILNSLGDPTASRDSTRSGLCISSSVIST